MVKTRLEGKCVLCGEVYTKRGMTRHLKACIERTVGEKGSGGDKENEKSLIVTAEGRYNPQYWLTLELALDANFTDLDSFLRRIWLECCGHMSAFKIRGTYYSIEPDYMNGYKGMDVSLLKVLSMGERFFHKYDFGTTTVLALRAVGIATRVIPDKGVSVLARNIAPQYRCSYCSEIAVKICQECVSAGKGWLCEECAQKHPCGEEMLLPVVNSPRTGVCAYTG